MRRAARPLTPEGAVLRTIRDGLRALRIPHWRCGAGGFKVGAEGRYVKMSDPGVPDLLVLAPGVGALFVEVKSATGKLSPDQVAFRDACRAAGAVHVVARGWADVEPWVMAPRLRSTP